MNKIITVPKKLKEILNGFGHLFTAPSHVNFIYLVAAIIGCEGRKTLLNLHRTIANVCKDKKAYQTYRYFLNDGKWDEDKVAQKTADVFLKKMGVENGKRVLVTIDDTFEEKNGKNTFGVGKFWDHKTRGYIWANNIVTSIIQCGKHFIPYKAGIYVKEEDVKKWNVKFRKKHEIAYDDIIKPLKVDKHAKVYVVVDAAYFNKEFIDNCRRERYQVCGRIKNNAILIQDDGSEINITQHFGKIIDEKERKITLTVRGKNKTYYIVDDILNLKSIGKCKVVASRTEEYLFAWADITGKDSKCFREHLEEDLKINWAKDAKIKKIDEENICVTNGENSLILTISKRENKVILRRNNEKPYEYILKNEEGKFNIYDDKKVKYYGCTDRRISAIDILYIYENRWNIETVHKEGNQKLGFKNYQMRNGKAIERMFQIIFLVWAILLLLGVSREKTLRDKSLLSAMINHIQIKYYIDILLFIFKHYGVRPPIRDLAKLLKSIGFEL